MVQLIISFHDGMMASVIMMESGSASGPFPS